MIILFHKSSTHLNSSCFHGREISDWDQIAAAAIGCQSSNDLRDLLGLLELLLGSSFALDWAVSWSCMALMFSLPAPKSSCIPFILALNSSTFRSSSTGALEELFSVIDSERGKKSHFGCWFSGQQSTNNNCRFWHWLVVRWWWSWKTSLIGI